MMTTSNISTQEPPIPHDHLYVLSFNAPAQFEALLRSFEEAAPDVLSLPRKFLINNSNDPATGPEYEILCQRFGFEQIKKDNLGITRGRQFVAEHFGASNARYCTFFEDDMLLHTRKGVDRFGFPLHVDALYTKALAIMESNSYDFLKLCFCEVYGDNSRQWAYYSADAETRRSQFLPEDFRDDRPLARFSYLAEYQGLAYAQGEAFYCNWPLVLSRDGNRKLFLDDPFVNPNEAALMLRSFEIHRQRKLKAAVLLASPINHNRIVAYTPALRKEC